MTIKDKKSVVLVCGPWGSGTSAVTGLLYNAGLFTPGPWHISDDKKTPITYEWQAYRHLLRSFLDITTLQVNATKDTILEQLTTFESTQFERNSETGIAAVLKSPLSILFLEELAQIFDIRIVSVLRAIERIEASRIRRGWAPRYGAAGAIILSDRLSSYLAGSTAPSITVHYEKVVRNPGSELSRLLEFCEFDASENNISKAIASIRR